MEARDEQSQSGPDDRNGELVGLLASGHRQLLAYVSSLVGNRHDAEDVVQRASVIMWRQFETFERGTNFMAWARTIAFYEARNFLRVSGRAKVKFDDVLLSLLDDERAHGPNRVDARVDALEDCIRQVDEAGRKLLHAVYGDDASVVGIAEALGKSPKTLYNRLSALRQSLALCIERRLNGGAQ